MTQAEFTGLQHDFWYEAHQVAIALSRDELWSAWSRDVDMKRWLLNIIECLVSIKTEGKQDVWYHGKNYHSWMPEHVINVMTTLFDYRDSHKAAHALFQLMISFEQISTELAFELNYTLEPSLSRGMRAFVVGLLQDNSLLPEHLKSND